MRENINFRDDIKDFVPYQPLKFKTEVKLDANESPFNLPGNIIDEVSGSLREFEFNRYPDPEGIELRKAIGAKTGFDIDRIVLGNGGDEILLNAYIAFGGPGRTAVIFKPTFSVYQIYATLTRTKFIEVERNGSFEITDSGIEVAAACNPDIVFLCNPNNPTGTATSLATVEKLAKRINGLVVLDEAYGEFADFSQLALANYENVGVLKTFSKAYSLASLRVGYMVASKKVTEEMTKVKLPYNLSNFSMDVARRCLQNDDIFEDRINLIKEERARLVKELKKIDGINVYPSQANYIYFQLRYNSKKVFEGLLDNGVLIRPFFNDPRLEKGLRVTVGSPEQNDAFLKAISQVIKEL